MKKQFPVPMLVRFTHDHMRRIKKAARQGKISRAEVIRECVLQMLLDPETD